MQNEEEAFRPRNARAAKRGAWRDAARGRDIAAKVRDSDALSTLFYIGLGILLALVARQAMAFTLQTDMPVVAVVSASMQHDNAEQTHYRWLQDNMGYGRPYVDSWPVAGGFLVGDMPIVQGGGGYVVGDVIVYDIPGQDVPIIHRIIKVSADGSYQTKGDNNMQQLTYEFGVRGDQVHGKVVAVIPKLGYFKLLTMRLFGV